MGKSLNSKAKIDNEYSLSAKCQLLALFHSDQFLRNIYPKFTSQILRVLISTLAFLLDKLNRLVFARLITKRGWPSFAVYGEKCSDAAFYVLIYAPENFMSRFYPYLRLAVSLNEASKMHLAMVQDRILMHRGRKQIYGSQIVKNSIWPII